MAKPGSERPAGPPDVAAGAAESAGLRERVARYLREHHTMTLATVGAAPGGVAAGGAAREAAAAGSESPLPHAASVFYAVDDDLRLVFLSRPDSAHGLHIGTAAPVAATITEQYADWENIQGVQIWGVARRVTGPPKALAMAVYLRRFPFLADVLVQPRLAAAMRKVAVYRVQPERLAFTDNTTGVFGREILDLKG